MSVRTILLIAFIATVAAVPDDFANDNVIPEMEMYEATDSAEQSFDEAKARVKALMEEGKSDKDCRKLADEEESMIKKDVKNNKKILDALTDGSSCLTLGKKAVDTAKKDLDKAKKNKKDTASALTKAEAAPVKFATVAWSSLTPGQCSTFFNQQSYKSATSAVSSAKKAKEKAAGALPVAQKAYDDAVKSAKKQKDECLCKTKKAHEKAWSAYSKTEPSNKKAWERAAHLKCVLDGTPLSKCKVTPCPTNSKPKLIKEAKNASCSSSGGGGGGNCLKGGSATFKGWTRWQQDCRKQTYADQNKVATDACKKKYPGSRAITYAELACSIGKNGIPTKNTSGSLFVANCSDKKQCLGRNWHGSKSGKAKKCFANNQALGGKPQHDTCCNSQRSAMCVV